MAPSKTLPAAKMSLVLSYFRTTSVAHTLKDLEKSLPSAAGISGMLVKDYIAALVADSLLMVEKIGSGNWYWSFPADTKRQKTSMLEQVRKERDKALEQVSAAENAVAVEKERLSDEGEEGGVGLVDRLKEMQALRVKLVGEVEAFADSKGTDVVLDERDRLRLKVNELVDNIFGLETYFKKINQDPDALTQLRQMFEIEEDMDYID